ncbi:MAG: SufD family Fe-S cluster assembly protein, partial [Thiothrix sp.]|nr:SufD family Fe-S cluster assembly protein [Thiothrix sp.]
GTTVGQIDTEMLFYLRSRGIPRDQAVNMVCKGFAGEILQTCRSEVLQQRAEALLDRQLAGVLAGMA